MQVYNRGSYYYYNNNQTDLIYRLSIMMIVLFYQFPFFSLTLSLSLSHYSLIPWQKELSIKRWDPGHERTLRSYSGQWVEWIPLQDQNQEQPCPEHDTLSSIHHPHCWLQKTRMRGRRFRRETGSLLYWRMTRLRRLEMKEEKILWVTSILQVQGFLMAAVVVWILLQGMNKGAKE